MKPEPILALILGCLLPAQAAGEPETSHWAFQPIRDPAPPLVNRVAWCRTTVDRFVLARIESLGLDPAPEADGRTLIRRATYNLTGLPPTPAEVDAFESENTPGGWERLLDRLLSSRHYGEHWGRHWLDVVRYADTAGETADYPVPVAWRYRNYVIDAFNSDKPYNEFLREQIAGDILARSGTRERYAERVTATGYLAISRRFGFDSENYHHLTLQDTIDTLGQSVLGLTLGCARCHAHKYDPVSQADYYGLYGIFDSTRYAFPGSEQKQRFRALVPLVPPEESMSKWREFESRIAALTAFLERQKQAIPGAILRSLDDLDGDFEMQAPAAGGSKGVLVPPWVYEGPIAVTTDAQSPFKNLHPAGRVGASIAAGTNGYRIGQALPPSLTRDRRGAIHVNLDFRVATHATPASERHRFWLGDPAGSPPIEVLLSSGTASLRTGAEASSIRSLHPGEWHNLQLTLDLDAGTVSGSVGRPGDIARFPARPLPPGWSGVTFVGFERDGTGRGSLPDVAIDNLGVGSLPMPPVSVTPQDSVGTTATPDVERARLELETLLAEGPFELAYGVSEGTPGDSRVHRRGEPENPGEVVKRGFLPVLGGGPLPEGTRGSGRLALADWLTHPGNPLTARVMVNRIWQYHFGQGLVKTPNDFGTRGQPPSHPELLDHLASEFIRRGWSVKAMHRLIMSSAVYRQGSHFSSTSAMPQKRMTECESNDECPAVSEGNPFRSPLPGAHAAPDTFSPFPRRRLSAEEIRDAILLVCGELDSTPGREHPFPPPTAWGYTQHGPFSAVYDHRRRSVYLMTQRLKRHPFLALFDGPDPNASTPERRPTIVPTQALYFLNDPFVHANAERFAHRVLSGCDDEGGRIDDAYRLAFGRLPTGIERAEAAGFLDAYRRQFLSTEPGDPESAAFAALARAMLASNEFLTVE